MTWVKNWVVGRISLACAAQKVDVSPAGAVQLNKLREAFTDGFLYKYLIPQQRCVDRLKAVD